MKKLLFFLAVLFLVACTSDEGSTQTTETGYSANCNVHNMDLTVDREDARRALVAYTCNPSNDTIHVVSVPVENRPQ